MYILKLLADTAVRAVILALVLRALSPTEPQKEEGNE